MRHSKTAETILFSILFLFFLQALSDFIEAIYAFGLLVTAFTIEVGSIILLFTPLLLLLFRNAPPRPVLLGIAYVAIAGRLVEPMLNPGGKLVAAGVSVGAFMLLFPSLLGNQKQIKGWQIGSGLLIALSLSIFLRTAGSSLDLSQTGNYQITSWLLAGIAGGLLWRADLTLQEESQVAADSSRIGIGALTIGLAAVILMIYFAFTSPTVIARWTGFSYTGIIVVLVTTLTIFAYFMGTERFICLLTPRFTLGWNALFVLALMFTILPHQVTFPSTPEAYPLDALASPPLATVPLFLMLVFSPILFIDFMLFAREISARWPSIRQLGGSFALAALFFLLMVFFHVFTTIYDYAPVVGPLFRDRFWLVYLLAGLGLSLPILSVRKETFDLGKPEAAAPFLFVSVGILAVLSVVALFLTTPKPTASAPAGQLKVMTYNIQQGFDEAGNTNLAGQLAVIRRVEPDILGLQESDTARVANGNVDAVRYFADNLDMYSYYGPTPITGTFGIALLSKYPIQKASTFFMYSKGEQTSTIHAEITVSGKTYRLFVTHLGNSGPMVQLENMLEKIQGLEDVIAMGDCNFRPTTGQYTLITQTLADSWLLKWPGGKPISGLSPDERIDYIFVSPETIVLESEYVLDPASDHPYLYTVIQP